MAAIYAENVADFVADTLKDLGKPNFTDISSPLQKMTAMNSILKKNRVVLDSGSGIQFNVLVNESNAARNNSLAESDILNLVDGMVQASTVWRYSVTSYMIIQQLASLNSEPARIVDYVKQQRLMAMIALAELMESNFWNAPSATDTKTPLGVPYWITKNATKGFNGGTLSGYSTVAGLNTTTYPAWNNWTAPYTVVSVDDFMRQISEASDKTDFMPTVEGIPSPQTGDDCQYYTNYTVYQQLKELLMAQNENLGVDVDSMSGKATFRRSPITWVPKLDADTTNPFYGINWGWFKLYINRGWWLKETNIPNLPGQHTVSGHFLDSTYAFVNKNRRAHFVASNGTSYPA